MRRHGVQLLFLTYAAATAVFARTTVGPLQEAIKTSLSLTDNQVALIQGPALVLPALILGWAVGFLVDHRSRARLVWSLVIIAVAGTALTALASGFLSLFIARSLVGLSSYGIPIAAASLISDMYVKDRRGRANTVLAVGEIAGMAAAFGLGGVLLQAASGAPTAWRTATWWLTLPPVIALIAAMALREPERSERKSMSHSFGAGLRELWAYRGILTALLGGLAMVAVADGASLVWVAPTLSRKFDLPPARVGAIVATAMFVGGTLGPLIGGILADLCRRTGGSFRTLLVLSALALASAISASFGAASTVTSLSVLLTLFLTVGGAINVAVMAALTTDIPNELRGLAVSTSVTAGLLFGFGLAPVSVSLISGYLGGPVTVGYALTLICVATSAIGTVAFGLGARQFAR